MGCCSSRILPQVELPELPSNIKHLTVNSPQALLDAVADVATRSFAGTKTTAPEPALSWAFEVLADPLGPLPDDPTKERIAYFKWLVTFMMAIAVRHGGCFALVDGDDDDAKVVACALNFPPNNHHLHAPGMCEIMQLMGKAEGPMPKCMEGKRMKAVEKAMADSHKAHARDPHWYVQLFAVDPAAQRQGHGDKLLKFITTLGDKSGVPVYLETIGSASFYEKSGFEAQARYPLTGGDDTLDANGGLAGMVRKVTK
jgi:ribosomal protein S18 acetylase RimI-like enzyme